MAKVPTCRDREVIRKLRRLGFEGPFAGGKHEFMTRGRLKLYVPNPHGSDLSAGLVTRLLKEAGIAEEHWEAVT